jgi:hypothetical protein
MSHTQHQAKVVNILPLCDATLKVVVARMTAEQTRYGQKQRHASLQNPTFHLHWWQQMEGCVWQGTRDTWWKEGRHSHGTVFSWSNLPMKCVGRVVYTALLCSQGSTSPLPSVCTVSAKPSFVYILLQHTLPYVTLHSSLPSLWIRFLTVTERNMMQIVHSVSHSNGSSVLITSSVKLTASVV